MEKKFETLLKIKYGSLDPKVNLEPDFFTGFDPARRKEIVTEEAAFYHGITQPYSKDDKLEKHYESFTAEDGYEIPVKIYRPKNATGSLPVVMFFHGGGFMTCSVETHDYVPSYLAAEAGVIAINVEYRLAPEYKFPRGLEDCYLACKWAIEHKEKLGIVEDRLFVCGDSSGGNFAAAIALMAKDRKEFDVYGQILIYPVTDVAEAVEKRSLEVYGSVCGTEEHPTPVLTSYFKNIKADAGKPYASPLLADDLEGLPKALFIQAECDGLVDDGLMYAKRLKDAGVPVECKVYEGMPHAFILRTYSETFEALDQICAFLKK